MNDTGIYFEPFLDRRTCWFFKLIDADKYYYVIDNHYYEMRKIFLDGHGYELYIYIKEYEGLLYRNQDDESGGIPFPAFLTHDGWLLYENEYWMPLDVKKYKIEQFRSQPFLSKENLLRYIDVELPQIIEEIEF